MGKSFSVQAQAGGVGGAAIRYFGSGNTYANSSEGTEANAQKTYRNAGTHRNLSAYISANTYTGIDDTVIDLRINGASGNLAAAITAGGGAGRFSDLSNSDAISAGDEVNLRFDATEGVSGSATATCITLEFEATSDTVSILELCNTTNLSTASTDYYYTPAGRLQGANSTANNAKIRPGTAGTWEKMFTYVSSNGRTTNTVFRNRINASNGAMSITYGSGATGIQEDLSNSDSVSIGDDMGLYANTSTGTGAITLGMWGTEFRTTNKKSICVLGNASSGLGISSNTTRYVPLSGSASWQSTEALTEARIPFACTASYLTAYVSANTNAAVSDYYVRKNNADTAITFQVGSTASGRFTDTTHSADFVAGDTTCYKGVAAVGGGTITFRSINVTMEDTTASGGTGGFDPLGMLGFFGV